VLLAEVNFVLDAAYAEPNRLIGHAAVKIIF
jgi:hypothetical protein